MLDIKSLEGHVIQALIKPFDNEKVKDFKLHRVEQYGVWVESQDYTNTILARAGRSAALRTFVAFVPWSGIAVVYGSTEEISLSEKSFGVQS